MIRAITITLAFLLCALRCFGVEWPVLGYEVETNGYIIRLTVSTSPDLGSAVAVTNGNFFGGWSTNDEISRVTGTNSLWLDVRGPGFNTDGTTNITGRRIYGTKIVRLPFGLGNTNDVIAENGTNVVVRVHLNSFVYASEEVKASSLSGWFATTNGGAGNFTNAAAFTSATATNSSTQTYPLVIANWVAPGFQWITNSTMRLRAMGGHLSAANGRPVECFQFVCTDEHSHIVTNVARIVPDLTWFTNGLKTAIYLADVDMSPFTALDQIRCDIIAMPRFGDTNCVLNTFRNQYSPPLPVSITNLYDPNHAYSDTIAIVDSVNGNDTNGRATNGPPGSVHANLHFATPTKAWQQIAATNNAIYGHNDCGGGTVYFRTGSTNPVGSTVGLTWGVPFQGKTWLNYMPYPGDANIFFSTNQGGTVRMSNQIHVVGIRIEAQTTTTTMFDTKELWLDSLTISNVGSFLVSSGTRTWVTHCDVPRLGASASTGFMANGAETTYLHIIDCDLDGFDAGLNIRTCVGNIRRTLGANMKIVSDTAAQPTPSNFGICYNNFFGGFLGANQANMDLGLNQGIALGFLFAQTVGEIVTNAANATFNMWSLNTIHYTNIIGWNNDILGKRVAGVMYNDQGTAVAYRYQCSFKNCIWDNTGFKSDTFNAPPGSASRIGNWPVILQVDWEGHYYVECDNSNPSDSPGSFNPEFAFNSYHPTPLSWASGVNSYTNPAGIVKFVNRQSAGSASSPAQGNGDYRLKSESPLFKLRGAWVLPYDIEGHIRSAMDPPGAYSAGNVKKGF